MATKVLDPVTYLLRDVDAQLWARFKARAESNGQPMRTALLQLVEVYAAGQVAIDQHTTTTTTVRVRKGGAR
jgi:hypothetical protein